RDAEAVDAELARERGERLDDEAARVGIVEVEPARAVRLVERSVRGAPAVARRVHEVRVLARGPPRRDVEQDAQPAGVRALDEIANALEVHLADRAEPERAHAELGEAREPLVARDERNRAVEDGALDPRLVRAVRATSLDDERDARPIAAARAVVGGEPDDVLPVALRDGELEAAAALPPCTSRLESSSCGVTSGTAP